MEKALMTTCATEERKIPLEFAEQHEKCDACLEEVQATLDDLNKRIGIYQNKKGITL